MEPAGKLPQHELLTQNELLKQQVGQDTEPWGTGKGMHVLNLHSEEPCVPAAARQVSVLGCWGVGTQLSILQALIWKDHSHGPSSQPICLGLGMAAGLKDGNAVMGLGEVSALSQVHPRSSLLPGENFRGRLPAGTE